MRLMECVSNRIMITRQANETFPNTNWSVFSFRRQCLLCRGLSVEKDVIHESKKNKMHAYEKRLKSTKFVEEKI